jgi:hypothetical protein
MHPHLPVDIDAETIQFDGAWRTRDELARTIRDLLDAGNYAVAGHSAALEALVAAVADVRTVELRATSRLVDDLKAAAAKEGRPVAALVRDAVARYLVLPREEVAADWELEGRRTTSPEMPAVVAPQLPKEPPTPAPSPAPVAAQQLRPGPGALRNAGLVPVVPPPSVVVDAALQATELVTEPATPEEAVTAVDLTRKPRADEPPPPKLERNWFGG